MTTARWSRVLAEFLCEPGNVPAAVRARAGVIFADTVAAMAAGALEAEVAQLLARKAPAGSCTMIGRRGRALPGWAALLNGIAGTAAEFDEGNYAAGGHPAVHCIPAALAWAEVIDASGARFVDAMIAGYEAGARVGAAVRLGASVHSHGTWGTVGAAVAVAVLRGYAPVLLEQAILAALGLCNASSRVSGLTGATIRHAFAGVAAQNGLLACDLVEAGFTGEPEAAEIVFASMLGSGFDPGVVCAGLGSAWYLQRNFFKLAASCRETHGSLDAFAALRAANPGWVPEAEAIAGIVVRTFDPASRLVEPAPSVPLAARYSTPFALATLIVRGACGPDDFRAPALADPRIRALAAKVRIEEDAEMTRLLPRRRMTRLSLTLADGRTLSGVSEASAGDAARPLSRAQHRGKFLLGAEPLWGQATPAIYDICVEVDDVPRIGGLTAMFRSELPRRRSRTRCDNRGGKASASG
jgi:2-methylcitrate dehydratase PrpD